MFTIESHPQCCKWICNLRDWQESIRSWLPDASQKVLRFYSFMTENANLASVLSSLRACIFLVLHLVLQEYFVRRGYTNVENKSCDTEKMAGAVCE